MFSDLIEYTILLLQEFAVKWSEKLEYEKNNMRRIRRIRIYFRLLSVELDEQP